MTTKPQVRPDTKAQRRLAKKQAAYDAALKQRDTEAKASAGAIHRPGSSK